MEFHKNLRDSLADLERYRLQLEENIAKLQASLRHWQTWEIEYEGMKEEILEVGEIYSSSDLVYEVTVHRLHSRVDSCYNVGQHR